MTQRNNLIYRTNSGLFDTTFSQLLKRFLQYVIDGKQTEADLLLKDNRQIIDRLLTEKELVKDYAGRLVKGTALQIALGAEDVAFDENQTCMVEMLEPHLKDLQNGDEIIIKQIEEQFPSRDFHLWAYEINEQDINNLKKVIDCIGLSKSDSECDEAIKIFCNSLIPKEVIQTGWHMNSDLLLKALDLFDEHFEEFGGWNSRKNNLIWRKVIGGIERTFTANMAQIICQGPHHVLHNHETLNRSLKFRNRTEVVYFPLDTDLNARLGHDYATCGQKDYDAAWMHEMLFDRVALSRIIRKRHLCTIRKMTNLVKSGVFAIVPDHPGLPRPN